MSFNFGQGGVIKWGALAILAISLLVIWRPGCRHSPAASSRESMELVKRLYSACNSRNAKNLAKLEKDVGDFSNLGKVTQAEQQAFEAIIAMTRRGDWEAAEKASLRLADDQVGNNTLTLEDR